VGAAAVLARRTRRRAYQDCWLRPALVRQHLSGRFYHLIGQFLVFGTALYVLGWGWVAQAICRVGPPEERWLLPGAEVLILAPFLTGMLLSWACFYDAEKALHDTSPAAILDGRTFWGRWSYVGFHIRHNLVLVLVPIGLLILQEGLQRIFTNFQKDQRFTWVTMGFFALAVIGMPWVVRLVLGLKPLGPGRLRQRLTVAARRLRFRCSDILVWHTRGGVVNAMVVGIVPWPRYVVLTDRLLTELRPEEVEAVFGHEVGHVRHRHMLYYLGFMIASLTVLWSVWKLADMEQLLDLTLREDLALLPLFGLLGTYIFLVFGFLSRRCERQADIYGCRAVSCDSRVCCGHEPTVALAPEGRGLCPTGIRTFISALERVADLNGISRDRPGWLQSWQHSTIARRVEFLERMLRDPTVEPRFQRVVGMVKWGFLLVLAAALLALSGTQGWTRLFN
jgi:Zn-dependent protease with chaperone function